MTAAAFTELSPERDAFAPPVDIFENEDAVLVKVELPGVRPDDVVIDATELTLTITGERRRDAPLEGAHGLEESVHRRERAHGRFARRFSLPDTVDGPAAVAVMADGVLTIRIPKREVPSRSADPARRAS